jgi:hypothetical protein
MTVQTKIDIAEVAEVLNQAELSKLRCNRKQLVGAALLAIVVASWFGYDGSKDRLPQQPACVLLSPRPPHLPAGAGFS